MKTQTAKGFKDFIGKEAIKKEQVKKIIQNQFELYGFEPAETPIIEYEDFVKGDNEKDEAVSDIFKLKDKGERNLALRYEFTFQLKRIAKNQKLPYKRFQIGQVFRDEPTTSNRFRQFTQCDADIIGSTLKDEAELLAMTSKILNKLNIEYTIYFNNRKLLNEILEKNNIKQKQEVIKEIDKLDKLPKTEIKKELKKYKAEFILDEFNKQEKYFEKYQSYQEIKKLKELCKPYKINIKFQPSLARGLSYYSGTIFEIKTEKLKETITAGGSFLIDGNQSTGISFGLERLSKIADIKIAKPILIISINQQEKSSELAEYLRENNQPALITTKSISKAMEYANSKDIDYVLILGEKEAKQNKIQLKNMKTGKQELVVRGSLLSL